jgi:glucose-1-phosphate cytidylyltransferase
LLKVVLFCGGLGTRLREHSDTIPKPLVPIGPRPIIWHLMQYYAHLGHKDFILCLGYKGEMIRDYFLNYDPYKCGDVVIEEGGARITPSRSDTHDWRITFVDTGLHANIGQRLVQVRRHLEGEDVFLANYSDQLSDYPLSQRIADFNGTDAVASMASVRPAQSFHSISTDDKEVVTRVQPISQSDYWVNGGYFIIRNSIFDYIEEGDDLVEAPFQRLIQSRKLLAARHEGFWKAMDTFKDNIEYERMYARNDRPWMIWTK